MNTRMHMTPLPVKLKIYPSEWRISTFKVSGGTLVNLEENNRSEMLKTTESNSFNKKDKNFLGFRKNICTFALVITERRARRVKSRLPHLVTPVFFL